MAIPFPAIDPVAIQIGGFAIRWYALAYIAGILLGWRYAVFLGGRQQAGVTRALLDDFLFWAMLGIVLGGRLGYVLLYSRDYYRHHLADILKLWEGGMAFHGGLCGVIVAMVLFCRQRKVPLLVLADIVAAVAPLGLFFGRLANFVNGELYGRVTSVPWGVVFPRGGEQPRHPSQLYEAGLEGLLLLSVLALLALKGGALKRRGMLSGTFLLGYGLCRMVVEQFRQPDEAIGLYGGMVSQGQLLSLPMVAAGVFLVWRSVRRGNLATA